VNPQEVRNHWAERSGEYSPAYYAHHGPDRRSEAVRDRLDEHVDRDAAVLELGSGCGRHLAHLREAGYRNPAGVELNGDAFDVMADAYPDLATEGTFYRGPIEDHLPEFPDGHFDAVYSVETLQHVHPDARWVFAEVARVTGSVLVTVENEGPPAADGGRSDSDGRPADSDGETVGASGQSVNYVNGEFPLYYRDWNGVFTDLGLVEVGASTGKRDTVRTFRVPGDRAAD